MSYSNNKYNNFEIEDWVIDDDFIAYINGADSSVFEKLSSNPKHAENIEKARKIVSNLSSIEIQVEDQKLDNIFNRINQTLDQPKQKPKPLIASMSWVGIAAAILVLFVVAFPFIFKSENNHITQIAEQTSFKLPDSSLVELNSVSSVKYNKRSWSKDRYLVLEGEAFFKVKKGSKFVVKSKQGVVSVLGTQFNISDRLDLYEVECTEGSVQVSINLGDSYELKKGDKLVKKGKQKAVIERNVVKEIDWLNKFVNIENQNMDYVFKEVERHYDVKFENINALKEKKYNGFFSTVSLDSAMQQIFWPMGVEYEIKDKKVIVK